MLCLRAEIRGQECSSNAGSVQRIVAELVDFRDNVTISVSVRAPLNYTEV